jgi:hypothetical protein
MPLILAIEPDRKQAGQLTAMVRGRLHAELVLADSAERALAALGQRIPDLVLTSALLSPKDETALGERLRALDGAAAHVQTLTIPVLASPSRGAGARAGGVLSALRGNKSKPSVPDGCDPAVFAEQCKDYLERAAAEREAVREQAASVIKEPLRPPAPPSPVTGSEWVVVREEEAADPAEASPAVENMGVEAEFRDAEPVRSAFPIYNPAASVVLPRQEEYEPEPLVVDEPTVRQAEAAPNRAPRTDRVLRDFLGLKEDGEGPASLLAAVAALEAEQQVVPEIAEPEPEPAPIAAQEPAEPAAESNSGDAADFDLSSLLDHAAAASRPAVPADDHEQVEVYELDPTIATAADELTISPSTDTQRAEKRSWPILEDLVAEWNTKPAAPAPAPAPPVDTLQKWDDIIEALRRDAEQLQPPPAPKAHAVETESTIEVADAAATTPNVGIDYADDAAPAVAVTPVETSAQAFVEAAPEPPLETAAQPEPAKQEAGAKNIKKRRTKAHPAQDEWGFFDPEQCGFAALIEKLEEITDKDDTPTPKPRRA